MPMINRRANDRINIFLLQQLTVILVSGQLRARDVVLDLGSRLVNATFGNITDGYLLDVVGSGVLL